MNLDKLSYLQNNFTKPLDYPLAAKMQAAIENFSQRLEIEFGSKIRIRREAEVKDWVKFLLLPEKDQSTAISSLEAAIRFMDGALEQGVSLADDKSLLTHASRQLGFSLENDLLDYLAPGDLVKILNKDFLQIYRNFNFFAYCNYSLLELSTYPWYELYERSTTVTDQLIEMCGRLFKGESEALPLKQRMEPYTVTELRTEEKNSFIIKEKLLARMRKWPSGDILILSVKQIEELAPSPSKVLYI